MGNLPRAGAAVGWDLAQRHTAWVWRHGRLSRQAGRGGLRMSGYGGRKRHSRSAICRPQHLEATQRERQRLRPTTQGPLRRRQRTGRDTTRCAAAPQPQPLVTALVVAGALLIVVATLATFWTEVLWYQSVDFSGVFTTQLVTKVLLGLVGGLITAAVVWSSIHFAYRHRPIYAPSPDTQAMEHYRQLVEPMRKTATIAALLAIGLFAGLSAATQWDTFLLWRNGAPFGTTDPEFKLDISFFVFDLPWINFVVSFLTMVLVLGFIAAAFTHYLYGASSRASARARPRPPGCTCRPSPPRSSSSAPSPSGWTGTTWPTPSRPG